jgi:hypothetical protein
LLRDWSLEESRPQLVSIVAPAGTGKTRLLEEFLKGLDPDEGWRVATGRCLPYGQSLTYWPLRGLLQDLIGTVAADGVVGALVGGGLAAADAERLSEMIMTTLGAEGPGENVLDRESIFNAWRLLIETAARDAPRVVIFEDLHWASDSLLDLVEHIMQPRTQAPLLVVAITRPELLDRRPAWGGAGKENVSVLALKPLNETQTEQLIRQLGGSLPESVRRQIAERSGGNPFFATELVRGLAERDVAAMRDAVPDTVHAAVLARLDALTPAERAVAQAASVSGRSFRAATLAAVTDLDRAEIDRAVEGLVARDMVVPEDGDSCAFRHVLIRDVAYGTLSRSERIRMHAAVAGWLENFASGRLDEFVELIAYHYGEAVRLSQRSAAPLPLPFDEAKAVTFLERAAQVAARSGALAEAQNHVRTAISLAPAADHVRLYERLGDIGILGSDAPSYLQAVNLWRELGAHDPIVGARLLRKLSLSCHRWPGRTAIPLTDDELAALLPEARRLAEEAGDEAEQWRIRMAESFEWWDHARRYAEVNPVEVGARQATALQAAAVFERAENWEACSEALDAATGPAMLLGRWDEAVQLAQRRLALPNLPPVERGDAQYVLLWSYMTTGEYERCLSIGRDLLDSSALSGSTTYVAGTFIFFALSAVLTGRWSALDEIKPLLAEALDASGSAATWLVDIYILLLVVALARESRAEIDAANAALGRLLGHKGAEVRRSIAAAYAQDDPSLIDVDVIVEQRVPGAAHLALLLYNERGVAVPEPFLEYLRDIRNPVDTVDALPPSIDIAEAIAARDHEMLARAIEEAERRQLVPHAARMRVVLAEMSGDPAPLERARPVLEQLGDRQFLRRLTEVAATL